MPKWLTGLLKILGVSAAQFAVVLDYVKKAAVKFIDNAERREWVVKQVRRKTKLPESVVRFLVEAAVRVIKGQIG